MGSTAVKSRGRAAGTKIVTRSASPAAASPYIQSCNNTSGFDCHLHSPHWHIIEPTRHPPRHQRGHTSLCRVCEEKRSVPEIENAQTRGLKRLESAAMATLICCMISLLPISLHWCYQFSPTCNPHRPPSLTAMSTVRRQLEDE